MTKIELVNLLELDLVDVPDNAEIYVYADHGQATEKSSSLSLCKDENLPSNGDDLTWRSLDEVKNRGHVTAICIEGL